MAPYHVVLVHFPIALWMTATLAILWRAVSNGPVALAIDRALVPLLAIGLVSGILAIAVGALVWPLDAISTSPMGRNHILLAVWTRPTGRCCLLHAGCREKRYGMGRAAG